MINRKTLISLRILKIKIDSKRLEGIADSRIIVKSKTFHPDLKKFIFFSSEKIRISISTRKNIVMP